MPRLASKWNVVREENKKQKAAKIALPWFKPDYWSNVTDEPNCSPDMPLDQMAKLIAKKFPYYTLIYCIINWALYSAKVDVYCYPDIPAAKETDTFPACNQIPYGYRHWVMANGTHATTGFFTPLTASFLHRSDSHIMFNSCLLGFFGSFLEFTEGHFFMAVLHLGAAPIGFGFHGFFSEMMVVGASGVIYAIFTAQIALLILNWKELGGCRLGDEKFIRLFFICFMTVMEAYSYATQGEDHSTSNGAHYGGALVGILVTCICAKNVKVQWYEPPLIAMSLGVYAVLCIGFYSTSQVGCGVLGLIIAPKLGLDTYMYWRRATITRKLQRGMTGLAKQTGVDKLVDNQVGRAAGAVVGTTLNVVDKTLTTVNDIDDAFQNKGIIGGAMQTVKTTVNVTKDAVNVTKDAANTTVGLANAVMMSPRSADLAAAPAAAPCAEADVEAPAEEPKAAEPAAAVVEF